MNFLCSENPQMAHFDYQVLCKTRFAVIYAFCASTSLLAFRFRASFFMYRIILHWYEEITLIHDSSEHIFVCKTINGTSMPFNGRNPYSSVFG